MLVNLHGNEEEQRLLDEVIFIDKGEIVLTSSADNLRNRENMSIDEVFRRDFKC